jgi:hypothetical protein
MKAAAKSGHVRWLYCKQTGPKPISVRIRNSKSLRAAALWKREQQALMSGILFSNKNHIVFIQVSDYSSEVK